MKQIYVLPNYVFDDYWKICNLLEVPSCKYYISLHIILSLYKLWRLYTICIDYLLSDHIIMIIAICIKEEMILMKII